MYGSDGTSNAVANIAASLPPALTRFRNPLDHTHPSAVGRDLRRAKGAVGLSHVSRDPQQSFHAFLTQLDDYDDQVASYHFFPPRRGQRDEAYDGPFAAQLALLGVKPYAHQASALRAVAARENVVVATATASGKSLAFQVPALTAAGSGGTTLLLYPTKALAHDQLQRLELLASRLLPDAETGPARVVAYDGDTPREQRPGMRATAQLNVVRRLLRVARFYGASPTVVAASATVGNPAEHAQRLTGLPFTLIDQDEAPAGAREFILWRPARVGKASERRRSLNSEAAQLAATFAREGVKSLFFCNSRKSAELIRRYAVGLVGEPLGTTIQSYRAGYTAADRRLIEAGFKNGDIRVLTSTSALELGVDIGGVDAVVLVGYPGSKMAMWQRSGRAGREGGRALTLLLPGADPLDEYYLSHPDLLIDGPVEDAVADPFNDELHPRHLLCAAAERPLQPSEDMVAPWLELADIPGLVKGAQGYYHVGAYPHRRVQLRGSGGKLVRLKDGMGRSLGSTDLATALRELHPGAIYLHKGEQFLVADLDLERGLARLLPHIEDYYTQVRSETDIEVLGPLPPRPASLGVVQQSPEGVELLRVVVKHTVVGYVRKRYFSEAILEERALELPEVSYVTQALRFSAAALPGAPTAAELPAALHALEHTLIGLLPAFVLCERADVGGVSYPFYPPTGDPTVFIYDGAPGGVGYARAGASAFVTWLTAARDLLRACPCQDGCPRCVLSPKCGNGNQYLDKNAAAQLAEALLARLAAVPPQLLRA